jgi:hypothetical protein
MVRLTDHGLGGQGYKGVIPFSPNAMGNAIKSKTTKTEDIHYNNDGGYTKYWRSSTNTFAKTVNNSAGTQVSQITATTDADIIFVSVPRPNEIIVKDSANNIYIFDVNLSRLTKLTVTGLIYPFGKIMDSVGTEHWVGNNNSGAFEIRNAAGTLLTSYMIPSFHNTDLMSFVKINNKLGICCDGGSSTFVSYMFYFENTTAKITVSTYPNSPIHILKSFARRL